MERLGCSFHKGSTLVAKHLEIAYSELWVQDPKVGLIGGSTGGIVEIRAGFGLGRVPLLFRFGAAMTQCRDAVQ